MNPLGFLAYSTRHAEATLKTPRPSGPGHFPRGLSFSNRVGAPANMPGPPARLRALRCHPLASRSVLQAGAEEGGLTQSSVPAVCRRRLPCRLGGGEGSSGFYSWCFWFRGKKRAWPCKMTPNGRTSIQAVFLGQEKVPVLHDLSFFLRTAKAACAQPLAFSEFVLNAWEKGGRSGSLPPSSGGCVWVGLGQHGIDFLSSDTKILVFLAKMVSLASCMQRGEGRKPCVAESDVSPDGCVQSCLCTGVPGSPEASPTLARDSQSF